MTVSHIDIHAVGNLTATPVNDDRFPSQLSSWNNRSLRLDAQGTHFGYVHSGGAVLSWQHGSFNLIAGMYFSVPGEATITGNGTGFAATRLDYVGFFQVGGPNESKGRLRYIDGCSDSLLISPVTMGDPCLNLLYLPPHTAQTEHVHPSCRLGMIVGGEGVCKSPALETQLAAGDVFSIPPNAPHSFHTTSNSLQVIAWHPDSDFGPTNGDHPMINRTIVNGVSAAQEVRRQLRS